MTVTELIKQLQILENGGSGNLEVMYSYNYGDYWHTQVAERVSEPEGQAVTWSDYHSMFKAVDRDEDDNFEETPGPRGDKMVIML